MPVLSGAPLADSHHSVAVNQICIGAKLRMPIHDERNVLLLAAGQFVTEEFLDHLASRGVQNLKVHTSDLPYVVAGRPQGKSTKVAAPHITKALAESNPSTRQMDSMLALPDGTALPPQGEAFARSVPQTPRVAYAAEVQDRMVENQVHSLHQLTSSFEDLVGGRGIDIDVLTNIADDALNDLSTDCDIFAALGLNPLSTNYPARHGLHCCFLALSIGTNLQLDKTTLRELAVGCLVHDAGMLKINKSLWQTTDSLNGVDFVEISKHSIRVFDALLLDREHISNRSAFIAYQMHERNDGTGYPRRRQSTQIHFLSKVAAVADVYAALTASRPHRPGLLPHSAIEYVVQLGNDGVLDANAVRALLSTTSMYPIGSYVLLSDGRVARTIRSNGLEFDSPVVEAWAPGELNKPGEVINLSEVREIAIVRPIANLDSDLAALSSTQDDARRTRIDRIVKLIDLADSCQPAEILELRRSQRVALRRPMKVYFKDGSDPEGDWQNHLFESRNISKGGAAIVGQVSSLPDEVVVMLENGVTEPIYMLSRVVRREVISDDWMDYGLMFMMKVKLPRSNRPHPN
jgi:HD-GYP domain-containing protein (c-di-GMP phosphodiesterase class II)